MTSNDILPRECMTVRNLWTSFLSWKSLVPILLYIYILRARHWHAVNVYIHNSTSAVQLNSLAYTVTWQQTAFILLQRHDSMYGGCGENYHANKLAFRGLCICTFFPSSSFFLLFLVCRGKQARGLLIRTPAQYIAKPEASLAPCPYGSILIIICLQRV